MQRLLFALALTFLLIFVFPVFVLVRAQPLNGNQPRSQILVKFREGIPSNVVNALLLKNRATVADRIGALDVLVLTVPQFQEAKITQALSKSLIVEYAEPNFLAEALFTPNDPYFALNQWGMENTGQTIAGQQGTVDADIDASSAWDVTLGGGVKVAVLDTGVDQDHEDLADKIYLQKNFTTSPSPDDFYGHGTHVAGIIAAVGDNGKGVSGGCPSCIILNGKVLRDDGAGYYSWIANGITWAADNQAKVINLSLGGSASSRTLQKAVNYAWNKGAVVVAAAGNSGNQSKTYPAAYANAIAVAATNNKDQRAAFSSYGAKWVDVAAPGENIFSTFPNHTFTIGTKYGRSQNYDFGSGTSMSTPMTSAAAALIWTTGYGTSASSVRSRLESTADRIPGTGTYWSAGRVNAASAVTP